MGLYRLAWKNIITDVVRQGDWLEKAEADALLARIRKNKSDPLTKFYLEEKTS